MAPDGSGFDRPGSIEQPRRRTGLSDLPHLAEETRAHRYPFLHPRLGVLPALRIARHHDGLGRVDRLCRPQIVAEPGHIGGEVLRVAEEGGIDRNEAMADIVARGFFVCIGR